MTTNQTIDGVPRELLERICAVDNGGRTQVQHHYDLIELRALLDAPVCKECEGVGYHVTMGVQRSCWACKPAAQPHGEPVAWQYRVSAGPQTGWSLWHDGKGEEFKQSYQVETRPLYAEQPAPVAVVLPERSNERDHAGDFTYEAKARNACLDEVTRLNAKR